MPAPNQTFPTFPVDMCARCAPSSSRSINDHAMSVTVCAYLADPRGDTRWPALGWRALSANSAI
jgi:hypothetical protein